MAEDKVEVGEGAQRLVVLPPVDDPSKLDVSYALIEPYAVARIFWDGSSQQLIYYVLEPELKKEEKELLEVIKEGLIEVIDVELSSIKNLEEGTKYLKAKTDRILEEYGLVLSHETYANFMYYVFRDFLGMNEIEPILHDPYIEDLECDGTGIPLYVIHKRYGTLRTNILFSTEEILKKFVVKLAQKSNRYVSYAEPLLDGTLPDGSRVNATFSTDVSTRGPTFSIRKFTKEPLTPIDLIKANTGTAELFAYLWLAMEHGASVMVIGGTATGKTTALNAISMFIPPADRIISIEDTRELNIPHENWIPGLSRMGFGPPDTTGKKYGEVDLFDLLRESFRQTPDYVIVGEVRGAEAYVLFQGMASGHPCLGTMHASSAEAMIRRLESPPMNLSPSLVNSLDVIITMVHAKGVEKSARRIQEIVEIRVEKDKRELTRVFSWDPYTDTYSYLSGDVIPKAVRRLGRAHGILDKQLAEEWSKRKEVLDWIASKNIRQFTEFGKIVYLYYKSQQKILEMMGKRQFELKAIGTYSEGPGAFYSQQEKAGTLEREGRLQQLRKDFAEQERAAQEKPEQGFAGAGQPENAERSTPRLAPDREEPAVERSVPRPAPEFEREMQPPNREGRVFENNFPHQAPPAEMGQPVKKPGLAELTRQLQEGKPEEKQSLAEQAKGLGDMLRIDKKADEDKLSALKKQAQELAKKMGTK